MASFYHNVCDLTNAWQVVNGARTGTAAQTAGAATQEATGIVWVKGTATQVSGAATQAGAGIVWVIGTITQVAGAAYQSATGLTDTYRLWLFDNGQLGPNWLTDEYGDNWMVDDEGDG